MNLVLTFVLLGLSMLSGMLGIGVAFAAVPFLSLYLPDLVHQVQPLSLLLNGITALFSLAGFAQAGYGTGGAEEFLRWPPRHPPRSDLTWLS